jgi:hemerythrin-like domain-containing protein
VDRWYFALGGLRSANGARARRRVIEIMPIQIGQKSSPTFQQPLELLSDCHRRVESFLSALVMVAEQARGGELDARQREAMETALRYFREAAPKHTADEEESLFPRMRQLGERGTQEALAKIQALEADHQVAKNEHDLVERLGQQWLRDRKLTIDETSQLLASLRQLQSIYARHIAVEDNDIFPLAKQVLGSNALNDVGREMAARRGQSYDRIGSFPHR